MENLSDTGIIGTCTEIEKDYFRLTSAPDPSVIRPPEVLKKSLKHVKARWIEDHNYEWASNQLKSMRQDLTVQHVTTAFTVHVYETHARMAIESDDFSEFQQCQTALSRLYRLELKGNPFEFLAYLILFYCVREEHNIEFLGLLRDLTSHARNHPFVRFAISTRVAIKTQNFRQFFRLCTKAPRMAPYILQRYLMRVRLRALAVIRRAYRPHVSVTLVARLCGFVDDQEACLRFLRSQNASLSDDELYLECARVVTSEGSNREKELKRGTSSKEKTKKKTKKRRKRKSGKRKRKRKKK
eukprot:177021_1